VSDIELSDAERHLRDLLRIWTALFAAGTLSFAMQPDRATGSLGLIPGTALEQSSERFWNALSVSLMATLTALCGIAASDVRRHRSLILPVLVSKAVSSGMFLLRFGQQPRRVPYLAGALCDGSILAVTLRHYRAAAGH
jgi:hypothetical protein